MAYKNEEGEVTSLDNQFIKDLSLCWTSIDTLLY